ncbi:MAG: lytic murein transglycosylase [Patescibacteria group bacterium]|nr:lytic murein transglycosylase [Patescibacteria group bacterium]
MRYRYIGYFLFFVILAFAPFVNASQLDIAQADKAQLEIELANLEAEIIKKQAQLDNQKGESKTLNNEINTLTTQIKKARLDIQAKNLTIRKVSGEINQKSNKIRTLEEKIELEKDSLAQLIRKNREIDNKYFVEFLLSNKSISETYGDLDTFASIKKAIRKSIYEIQGIKIETEEDKKKLEIKKNKETDVKVQLEKAKKEVEKNEKSKKTLLSISKNKEKAYQLLLEERQAEATKIRARLFKLAGGVSGGGIEFGDAVKYAKYAESKTGVRASFILGILKQESNIGKNVGLCYLSNASTGESRGMNTGRIFKNGIKPTRDVTPFLELTERLGLNPYQTRISCPIGSYGWGGAMGPSQFIPSTWIIFADKIAKNFNVSIANPWNPQHAIMATAIYLDDLGADKGGFTAEREAACRYYSGRSCMAPNVKNLFYGNAVMEHTDKLEDEIKFIEEN